jgi:hypothetical protein
MSKKLDQFHTFTKNKKKIKKTGEASKNIHKRSSYPSKNIRKFRLHIKKISQNQIQVLLSKQQI